MADSQPVYDPNDPARPFGDAEPMEGTSIDHLLPDTGTESVTITDERKVTWGYARKKNLGTDEYGNPRYESEEASLYITDMCPAGVDDVLEWTGQVSENVFAVIKPAVWDALDLDFSYDTQTGMPILAENEKPKPRSLNVRDPEAPPPPKFEPSAPPPPPPPAPAVVSASTSPPPPLSQNRRKPSGDRPTIAQVGYYADQPQFCKDCGNREFYDNRGEQDQAIQEGRKLRPDWKCKQCGKGVFRPGSYDYNKAMG